MGNVHIFLKATVLFLFSLLSAVSYAETYSCISGSMTLNTFSSGDIVIATDGCASLTLNCNSGTGSQRCRDIEVYAASQSVTINCNQYRSCYNSKFEIGIPSKFLADPVDPDANPIGHVESDFSDPVDTFNITCNGTQSCRNLELKTYQDVKDQTVNCEGSRSCIGSQISFFNSFTDQTGANGFINLLCGTSDRLQCDTADVTVETAGAPYSCTGATCAYIGCASVGCGSPASPPPAIEDPDGDGVSSAYDPDHGTTPAPINSAAENELLLKPKYYRFGSETIDPTNCEANSTPVNYSITNVGRTTKTLSGIPTLAGAYPSEFRIINNTCSNGLALVQDASCTFQAVYCPSGDGNKSAMITVNNDDPETPVLTSALFGFEAAGEEVKRRIPAVLRSVSTTPAITGGVFSIGTTYTIEFTLDGYSSNYQTFVGIFKCVPGSRCGKFYADNRVAQFGPLLPSSSSVGGGDVVYQSITSNSFDFSFSFNPADVGAGDYVLRVYHKSALDLTLSQRSISLLIPGGDVGLPAYEYDVGGRRLSFTVQ